MILPALTRYYERLEQDPQSDIAPLGFSRQKITFCVVVDADGTVVQIEPRGSVERGRRIPELMTVPGNNKPSGSGINPCFLWDNSAYMLGRKADDPKPERTDLAFAAFRERHLKAENEIDDEHFSAVCRFLEQWSPASADMTINDLAPGFGVFRVRAARQYVHERPKVIRWWRGQINREEASEVVSGQCLVTGETRPLAQVHEPAIKDLRGAQAQSKIVSFNADAFESYGKAQSLNAPVSQLAAFQYCTALNRLLSADSRQRVSIGGATVVFWTERPTPCEELFGFIASDRDVEDESLKKRLAAILGQMAAGRYPDELGPADTPFYLLALSPNAARIAVRFWLQSTLGDIATRLGEHYRDLAFERSPSEPVFPTVFQILRETAREAKDISPVLEGALLRAIWTGSPYPESLYAAVIQRIRADRYLGGLRVSVLKAALQRRHRLGIDPLDKDLSMTLDPDRAETAYQLGRLFAVLERAQEQALPDLNDTIKDRYFGAASATPATVFPRLIRLNQHHLGKLEKGARIFLEKLTQGIVDHVRTFPTYFNLKQQGLFAIGYYHQRQSLFKKRVPPAAGSDGNSDTEEE